MDSDNTDPVPVHSGDEFEGLHGGLKLDGLEDAQRRAEIAANLFGTPLEPAYIGRHAILRKLGAGGMGLVYVAYDERLDRRVAVKLLRRESATAEATARLEREAQAMARLSHPNVVTVHEVGTHAGEVFVAMELVEGSDLRVWLAAEERPWRSVLEQFRQAGEGLRAAHEGGIVHRDFKPDNVLVGDDGRVRVADFGLAHGAAAAGSWAETTSNNDVALTRTGALAGTPAYMPPEQYLGRGTDARSDQFSFCVALWEGLYGQRPFVAANLRALANAITEDELAEPTDERGVPSWLHAILRRGLAKDPDQRWPSMQALLDALDNDPRVRWRRFGAAVALAVGCLALVMVAWLAARELGENTRQRYYNGLTVELLEIERDRGLRQAQDDAARARDATRMSVVRSHELESGTRKSEPEDPTIVSMLLREVEGELREGSAWLSAANRALGRASSRAVLRGHRGEVSSVVYAPDGRWLYSASTDGEIWRWDRSDFRGERIVHHERAVTKLAISDDGQWLASSSLDGSVYLWSVQRETAQRLAQGEAGVRGLAFDPRSRRLATASEDSTVRIYALGGGPLRELDAGMGVVLAVDFDPTGTWLLAGSSDGASRLWKLDSDTSEPVEVFEGHSQGVYFVELMSARQAVTAADDGTARLWTRDAEATASASRVVARHPEAIAAMDVYGDQLATGSLDGSVRVASLVPPYAQVALPTHADQVWGLVFTDDGEEVVSASFDHTVRISRADGRGDPRVLLGHRGPVVALALDASGRSLATGSYDSQVRLWDLQRPRMVTTLRGHTDKIFSVEVDAAGDRAVTASHDGSARVWAVAEGTLLAVLDSSDNEVRGPASGEKMALNHAQISPDGERVATARNDGMVSLWTVADGSEQIMGSVGHAAWRLTFDQGGRQLAASSKKGAVRVWDLVTGAEPLELEGHEQFVWALAFENRTGHIVTASWDTTLRVWDGATGQALATSSGHTGKLYALAQSPDGRTWATGADDGTARLWSGLGGESLVLAGHENAVCSLAFDATGASVVTGGYDGRAVVWSVEEGQIIETLEGHKGKVWDVEFLADGRVVTASGDGILRVWSPGSGAPPLAFGDHGSDIQSLAMGQGGSRVISASADGTAKVWRVDLLSTDANGLRTQLWQSTSVCLDVDQRRRELGETAQMAADAVAACARRVAGNSR